MTINIHPELFYRTPEAEALLSKLLEVNCFDIVRTVARFGGSEQHPLTKKLTKIGPAGNVYRPALRYKQILTPPAGARCPEPYVQEAIYCVGDLPGWDHTVYIDERGVTWFVASYCAKGATLDPRFFPAGPMFILHPWLSDTSIDLGESRPHYQLGLELTKMP